MYYAGTSPVPEGVAASIRGRSYKIIADVELTDKASGVIFAHGSRFGGHALFIKDRKLYYVYNFLGIRPEQKFMSKELAPGKYALGMEFNVRRPANTASRLARRGCTSTTRSPPKVRCACRSAFTLSGDGLCIGFDSGDNVSQEYRNPGRFTGGRILGVAIDVSSEKYLDLEQEAVAALARD